MKFIVTDNDDESGNVIKPKYRSCWHCNRKLQGNDFAILYIDGAERVLHKHCRNIILLGEFSDYTLGGF